MLYVDLSPLWRGYLFDRSFGFSMTSELLKQVRVLDPATGMDRLADAWIENGILQQVADAIDPAPMGACVREARGAILAPGLVDAYSHSSEPGFEQRDTLHSLLEAAAAGGILRLAVLPDTDPTTDSVAGLTLLRHTAQATATRFGDAPCPRLYLWGALTQGTQGEQLTELAELASSGAVGFADGRPIANLLLLRRAMEYLRPLGKPLALVACDRRLAADGVMREGIDSLRLGLEGVPAIAETTAIAAILELVRATGAAVHLMRVSTRRGVALIQAAKAQGLPVTASTTWMHLLLDTEAIAGGALAHRYGIDTVAYNPNLHLDPPLGTPADREVLIAGIKEGIIDAIAIDHTPFTYEEKTLAFGESPAGAIGLELALPLLWQHLVATEKLSALELWHALSTAPAKCLHQTPPAVTVGQSAELVLFDPQEAWTVARSTLKSLSANTPWWGQSVQGRVVQIWC